jgi:putative DNA primase/helicase
MTEPRTSLTAMDGTGRRVGEQHRGQVRMAYRLAESYADRLMFVHSVGWLVWDGKRWAEDDQGEAVQAVLDVLRDALAESLRGDKSLRGDVRKCESSGGVNGVLAIAAALEPFAFTVRDLDVDEFLLNCSNGTLDLRTMTLRKHHPADRITKITRAAWRPDVQNGQRWQAFLERVLPDPEVRHYLQRLVGLSLLGRVVEHIFAVLTGPGGNGKGTAYGALLWMLGDYGHAAEMDLFMQAKSNPNQASPALMSLRGKRLVVASETEKGKKLAVALMKNLTGGDPITTRPLYGHPVTFAPSHTVLMVTNDPPKVPGDDPAVWRRIRVVPFEVVIPEGEIDRHIDVRLQLDADAILSWAVEGYRQYETRGRLDEPQAVLEATGDYQAQSDVVRAFIGDSCLTGPLYLEPFSTLYERWTRYAKTEGGEPGSPKAFGQALDRLGYPDKRTKAGRHRQGLRLYADDADDPGNTDG